MLRPRARRVCLQQITTAPAACNSFTLFIPNNLPVNPAPPSRSHRSVASSSSLASKAFLLRLAAIPSKMATNATVETLPDRRLGFLPSLPLGRREQELVIAPFAAGMSAPPLGLFPTEVSMEQPLPSPVAEGMALLQVTSEAKKQVRLAVPLIVGCLLQNVIQMISVMFVGHLGELALASASMASSFAIVTGFSFLTGMSCSLETLCGQAFGANQDRMLGVYKQRAMLVLSLVSLPIAAVWANTGWILLHLGQDPEIAAGAGLYIRWMIPALFFYGWLQCHVRFLQTQKVVVPMMLSSGVTAVNHVLVCWALVYKLDMGIKGAALANAISYLTNVSILALYVRFSPSCKDTSTGFSCEAFHDIPAFMKLAVPSAIMVCMEWWSFEVMVLLAGLLPNPKLETAVLSICLNTNSLVCTVPNGLSSTISTRVSNELGAGRPWAALLAARVVILLAFLVGTSEGLLLILVRNVWGHAYSKDHEVVAYVARMMLILAPSVLFDGLQYVLSGIVRGCGRQKIGAFVNFVAYYLVGIPAALVFTFVCHLGVKGLWLGIVSGLVTQTLLLLVISFGTNNWEKQVMNAKDRIFTSSPVES